MCKIAIICVSDRSYAGTREDLSGPAIKKELSDIAETSEYICVPDEMEMIESELVRLCDTDVSIIITTGGTGLAPRDVTPEATLAVAEKNVPGIAEAIRAKSLAHTPMAMLSRSVSVIRNNTLIINFPGSPKAAAECAQIIRPVICHAAELLSGNVTDCARQ